MGSFSCFQPVLTDKNIIEFINTIIKKFGGKNMENKISGILMIVLGVILAIVYFLLPTFLIYTYWIAVIALVGYGAYLYTKKG
jgi:hypothetical protein